MFWVYTQLGLLVLIWKTFSDPCFHRDMRDGKILENTLCFIAGIILWPIVLFFEVKYWRDRKNNTGE